MTNEITVFNFNENQIRTQIHNGEPYFCLADVCRVLELKNSRMTTSVKDVKTFYTLTPKGKQNINYVNEPNLYRLIFRSNKPQAEIFADWVYSEVLPSIRKTGSYSVTDKPVIVSEHTRALPSPKKEIVLSEKAKTEIGGIVKAVVGKSVEDYFNDRINERFMLTMRQWMTEIVTNAIRSEIAPFLLKDGVKSTPAHNGYVTADGLPVANWITGIIHGATALNLCISQMRERQADAVKLLEH